MKKLIMILFVVALGAMNASAQDDNAQLPPQKKTPEQRANNMTKRMTKELALTTDQQAKINALILKREKQREEDMKARKVQMQQMDAEFKAILNADQYQKFEQKKEEMRKKRQEKRMHPGTPPPAPDNTIPPPAPPVQNKK